MSILIAAALAQAAGTITFTIDNVRSARGKVLVAVCPQDKFLKEDCAYNAEVPARPGTVTIIVRGVPAGDWAAQAFHDENNNEEVDQGFLGIPKEGLAFSNDARVSFGPPKWSSAHFAFAGGEMTQRVKMRYMTGPKGPPKR
jgi:uncharacterized protein (DUF2141 family)